MTGDETAPDESPLERGRQRYSPFTEVIVTSEEDGDTERLYVGHITGASMLRTWTDPKTGEQQHRRYVITDRVDTPRPMSLDDVIEWVESGPDELDAVTENKVPDDLGESIGFSEWYPSEDDAAETPASAEGENA